MQHSENIQLRAQSDYLDIPVRNVMQRSDEIIQQRTENDEPAPIGEVRTLQKYKRELEDFNYVSVEMRSESENVEICTHYRVALTTRLQSSFCVVTQSTKTQHLTLETTIVWCLFDFAKKDYKVSCEPFCK